jgi:hypothetical protein
VQQPVLHEATQPQRRNQFPVQAVNKKPPRRVYIAQAAILASVLGAAVAFSLLRLPDTTPPPNLSPSILAASFIAGIPQTQGQIYWVASANDLSPDRSVELFAPLVIDTNCFTYTPTGNVPCGPSEPTHRPVRFCIVLDSNVPLQVAADGSPAKSINDLYEHGVDKNGGSFTVNDTGWV